MCLPLYGKTRCGFIGSFITSLQKPTESKKNSTPPRTQGYGTGGKAHYEGHCPLDREHRYFFKLYALDIKLKLERGVSKEELETAMKNHIIEKAELIGLYCKKSK